MLMGMTKMKVTAIATKKMLTIALLMKTKQT